MVSCTSTGILTCSSSLDHVPILTTLPLGPDQGLEGQQSIKPDSKAEENFVDQLTTGISHIDVCGLTSIDQIGLVVDSLTAVISKAWLCYSKEVRITKHSNLW